MKQSQIGRVVLFGITSVLFLGTFHQVSAHDELNGRPHHIDVPANPTAVMRAFSEGKLADDLSVQNLTAMTSISCMSGYAGVYPCESINLRAFMPLSDIGSTQSNDEANDIWGWTDPLTGNEYAIIGRVFGTSFVDISDPVNPVYLGQLATHGRFGSSWRDIKVYNNHAIIVSEARRHGMQIFDLTQLRGITTPPVQFSETAHSKVFNTAHNIVINESSGFAYGVGTDTCNGGLAMVNIQDLSRPTDAGCYSADGYTHDAQCVIYNGPDTDYQGKEICFNSNEDTLTIVNVTNKDNPEQIARGSYTNSGYSHQGWLTEDQTYFLLDDELDELNRGHDTLTRVWDLTDLDAPMVGGSYENTGVSAIDHNQYIHGNCSFQANYRAGLRILEFNPTAPASSLAELAYFDIYPADNDAQFNAAWSNYPYFDSGVVIISGIEQGLYVVKPTQSVLDACGLNNTAPIASFSSPAGGATVDGDVFIGIGATDIEDTVGSLTAQYRVDNGIWITATYNSISDLYEDLWDSTTVIDGTHAITILVTDSGGKSVTDTITISTSNGHTVSTMHVESLSPVAVLGRGGKWDVTITVSVRDSSEGSVSNAIVYGTWSDGTNGTGNCTTNGSGTCEIIKTNINRNSAAATFTVDTVELSPLIYDESENHQTASIIVTKPN